MSKKLTFAEKLKMQNEGCSPEVEKVEEKVEEVEVKPKKERKPRKKAEKKVEEKVEVIEVKEEEEPKKERKSRKKQVLEGGTVETETKKPVKEKRPPTAYNLFVKDAYKSKEVQKLPPNQRFAKVAELWHKEKAKKTKSKK